MKTAERLERLFRFKIDMMNRGDYTFAVNRNPHVIPLYPLASNDNYIQKYAHKVYHEWKKRHEIINSNKGGKSVIWSRWKCACWFGCFSMKMSNQISHHFRMSRRHECKSLNANRVCSLSVLLVLFQTSQGRLKLGLASACSRKLTAIIVELRLRPPKFLECSEYFKYTTKILRMMEYYTNHEGTLEMFL